MPEAMKALVCDSQTRLLIDLENLSLVQLEMQEQMDRCNMPF